MTAATLKTIRSRKTAFGSIRWMQFQREENKGIIILLDKWIVKSRQLRATSLKSETIRLTKNQYEFAFDILREVRKKARFKWQLLDRAEGDRENSISLFVGKAKLKLTH